MKLKTKIARVSILALSFCLLFVGVFVLSSHEVKASSIPIELVQYEIIDSDYFDDLPYLTSSNPYDLKHWTFGYYYYNGGVCYFLVLTPSYTNVNHSPCIIYMTYTDIVFVGDELVDNEYYEVSSSILSDSCDTIIDICVDSGFIQSAPTYYILQNNFYSYCCTGYYHNSTLQVYADNVETQPEYMSRFGVLNTAYYQQSFYTHILDHVSSMLSNDGATYDVSAYQNGVKYGKQVQQETVNSLNGVIAEKNEIIEDLREQLLNADTNFADFRNLLSAIFMFPVHFFTEGLNVNIFGINLGDFLLGLFMIVILMTVFKFLLGRRF